MKKMLAVSALVGLLSFDSFAQRENPRGEKRSPEKVAEFKSQKMKKDLDLDENQYKKLHKYHLEEAKSLESAKAKFDKEVEKNREKRNKQYASVLTPQQLKKWEDSKIKSDRRGFRKDRKIENSKAQFSKQKRDEAIQKPSRGRQVDPIK